MNYLAVRGVGDPSEEAGAPANGNPPLGKNELRRMHEKGIK